MMTGVGPAIGRAYVPGYGEGIVFATENKNHFTVQIDKTGIRHWIHRDRLEWRTR